MVCSNIQDDKKGREEEGEGPAGLLYPRIRSKVFLPPLTVTRPGASRYFVSSSESAKIWPHSRTLCWPPRGQSRAEASLAVEGDVYILFLLFYHWYIYGCTRTSQQEGGWTERGEASLIFCRHLNVWRRAARGTGFFLSFYSAVVLVRPLLVWPGKPTAP